MRIARPFGIPVYISPYWFLIAGLFVYLYGNSAALAGSSGVRYVVAAAFVVLLYVSVLFHELSHSLVARRFGLPVRRILLYPLGGFSEIEQEPPTPGREFLVSGAGPLLSLVLAGLGWVVLLVSNLRGLPGLLVEQLVWANLLVGIFNLLPGLPLDGGRMLRAGVWKATGKPGLATIVAAWPAGCWPWPCWWCRWPCSSRRASRSRSSTWSGWASSPPSCGSAPASR